MADKATEELIQRIERAEQEWQTHAGVWDECYRYAMPGRQGFYGRSTVDAFKHLFDSTAIDATDAFASRMAMLVAPPMMQWLRIEAGPAVPQAEADRLNRALKPINDAIFSFLRVSNFDTQLHEAFLDLAVGTAFVRLDFNRAGNPFRFKAVPLTHMVAAPGPFDDIGAFYPRRVLPAGRIRNIWPEAKLPVALERLVSEKPDEPVSLVEAFERDYDADVETWDYRVIYKDSRAVILHQRLVGPGSCPIIGFRWAKAAGEVYGRGPLFKVLPTIRVVNLVRQYVLESAEINLLPIFQYDDDGVINPDTIQLVPSALIPRAPDSRGLEPLVHNVDTGLVQFSVQELQREIRDALFEEDFDSPGRTPRSAREIAERAAKVARRANAPFGRLMVELIQPLARRMLFVLRILGLVPDELVVDGRNIIVVPVSPIARAQKSEDMLALDQFMEMVQLRLGPQAPLVTIDQDAYLQRLADLLEVPRTIIRPPEEQQQIMQQLQQAAGAQQ